MFTPCPRTPITLADGSKGLLTLATLFALADKEMTLMAGTRGLPGSIAESKARWREACDIVVAAGTLEKIQKHMPKVLADCIKNNGGPTRY